VRADRPGDADRTEPVLPEAAAPYRHKSSAAAVVSARAVRAGTPYSAMVEVADRCNEACVHCYQVQGQKGELPTMEWKRIFDELAELGVMFLTISGGEPTLRRDFLELVTYARRKRFAVKIYSNALNIDRALADELGRLAVQEVQISLYSHRADVHDSITRVPGSFDRVVAATRYLRAANVRVVLKSPLMKKNAALFPAYIAFVTSLGADYSLDPNLSPREDGSLAPTELSMQKADYLLLMRDPRLAGKERPRGPKVRREHPCGACRNNVHVEANGELRPCTQWNVRTGHALETGLREAWYEDAAAESIRALTWESLPGCRRCDLRDQCQRCFADAERYVGDALAPYAKACQLARWRYEVEYGTAPEIDSPLGCCEVLPVGPFHRRGEHQFDIDTAVGEPRQLTAQLSPNAPIEARNVARSRAVPSTTPSAPGQLIQIRRRAERSL
jgi:radical SAM protein with 4Fe4S-binding SPASM domain